MRAKNVNRIFFISRHRGSIEWIKEQNIKIDHFLEHMDKVEQFKAGDTIIGSLPVHIVAQLNLRGVRFLHFQLDLPNHLRGQELSVSDIETLDVQIKEYVVCSFDPIDVS